MSVNNKFYFRSYNDDYREGGIFANLDSSELCGLIKLQAYSDGDGLIQGINGSGLGYNQLEKMLNLNNRTVKKILTSLEYKEHIKIYRINIGIIIHLPFFVFNHNERELYEKKSDKEQRAIQQAIATKKAKKNMDDAIQEGLKVNVNKLANIARRLEKAVSKDE